jgi:hypothetical protein
MSPLGIVTEYEAIIGISTNVLVANMAVYIIPPN